MRPSCTAAQRSGTKPEWQKACADAAETARDDASLRRFFEADFTPYAIVNPDGSTEGTITGYYEPLLRGSRKQSPQYRYPVFAVPDDLLVVDLGDVYPDLKNLRLRGRVDGRRVVPYYSRADIESGKGGAAGREILWVDDPVDLFFLQIQGSGRVALEGGEVVRLSYAEQNGYPYRSVGRLLVERGELTLDQASMQGIKAWGIRNPDKLPELLNSNASYVFFRELPVDGSGPPGALGVPLSSRTQPGGRSARGSSRRPGVPEHQLAQLYPHRSIDSWWRRTRAERSKARFAPISFGAAETMRRRRPAACARAGACGCCCPTVSRARQGRSEPLASITICCLRREPDLDHDTASHRATFALSRRKARQLEGP